jgi:hypothetical protein
MDHNYLIQGNKAKTASKKPLTIERAGSIEYSMLYLKQMSYILLFIKIDNPSSDETEEEEEDEDEEEDDDDDDDDDERDSSSLKRKSIITTRAQAASRNFSKNRRKSSPPKKRLSLQYPTHRPNTRINRRIIEHDLKLLRQANILPPLSPPTNQQPLDLSLGPNRSSSYEELIEKTAPTTIQPIEELIPIKPTLVEGVLDLSLSR